MVAALAAAPPHRHAPHVVISAQLQLLLVILNDLVDARLQLLQAGGRERAGRKARERIAGAHNGHTIALASMQGNSAAAPACLLHANTNSAAHKPRSSVLQLSNSSGRVAGSMRHPGGGVGTPKQRAPRQRPTPPTLLAEAGMLVGPARTS